MAFQLRNRKRAVEFVVLGENTGEVAGYGPITPTVPHTAPVTSAARRATANLAANRAALRQTQPDLAALSLEPPHGFEWVYARDGTLTAQAFGQWWGGCSIPYRASQEMLRKMDIAAPVTCFLIPPMAGALRVALEKLGAQQAVVAFGQTTEEFSVLLGSEDFSAAILAHRLWFAIGEQWEANLDKLFSQQPGLTIPSQFLRLPMSDEKRVEDLIRGGQTVFSRHTISRSEMLGRLSREMIFASSGRWCAMCPSHFGLWRPEGDALAELAKQLGADVLDTDDPSRSSSLQLAISATTVGRFLAPNFARSDMPGVVPLAIPWVTWVTNGRIPRFEANAPHDRLLVIDEATQAAAIAAGWPSARVRLAGWPTKSRRRSQPASHLTVIADTHSLDTPADLEGFSSHRVLWDSIREELKQDAFQLLGDPAKYLAERMQRYQISSDGFPFDRFITQLIVPAYQQTLVRSLIEANLPLKLYGRAWDTISEFAEHAAGAIQDRGELELALDKSSVLVHVWPSSGAHAIDSAGLTVVRRTGRRKESFVRDSQAALRGAAVWPNPPTPALSAASLQSN